MSDAQKLPDARYAVDTGGDLLVAISSYLVYIGFSVSAIGFSIILYSLRKEIRTAYKNYFFVAFAIMSLLDGALLALTINKKVKKLDVPTWYGYTAVAPYVLLCFLGMMPGELK